MWRVVDVAKEVVRHAVSGGKDIEQLDPWASRAVEAVGLEAERAVCVNLGGNCGGYRADPMCSTYSYAAFEQHMDEYLEDEVEWIKNVLDKMCKAWDTKVGLAR